MFAVTVIIIFVAGITYAAYTYIIGRREARAYGRHMHVRYSGHTPLYQRRTSASADFGVTPDPNDDSNWQYQDASPTALDLLYEQMEEQRWREGCRRREEEREQGY